MISSMFTLNPYALEKLPFHYSDFFHFGLTEDVKSIWMQLPFYSRTDTDHYSRHKHAPHSNEWERKFRTRYAVEQHVHFHIVKRAWPDVRLDYHNDLTSREESISILTNDFILCDMVQCRANFPKWGRFFAAPFTQALCITPQDWDLMATMADRSEQVRHLAAKVTGPVAMENGELVYP
jgi:hypothetical protein